jgi:hypothetical protein
LREQQLGVLLLSFSRRSPQGFLPLALSLRKRDAILCAVLITQLFAIVELSKIKPSVLRVTFPADEKLINTAFNTVSENLLYFILNTTRGKESRRWNGDIRTPLL